MSAHSTLVDSAVAQSTPIKHKLTGTEKFTFDPVRADASREYRKNCSDMKDMFVGPMPVHEFLDEFFPAPKDSDGTLLLRPTGLIEADMSMDKKEYEIEFVRAIHATSFCEGLLFVDTRHKPDETDVLKRKPDITAYPRFTSTNPEQLRDRVNWREMELFLEVKPLESDPFVDPPGSLSNEQRKTFNFQRGGDLATHARGQIISYAHAQSSHQFRTSLVSVCLMGEFARLLRFDSSGATVTERFNWRHDSSTLAEFFWRFTHSDPEGRGADTSVSEPTQDEMNLARAALNQMTDFYPRSIRGDLHKFCVRDDRTGELHHVIAPMTSSHAPSLVGRATSGYVAYDVERRKCVYLKDSWRIDDPEFKKEGEIYHDLHTAGVPNIPILAFAGDLRDSLGERQTTRTPLYVQRPWACKTRRLTWHSHYRIAFDTIALPLSCFKSTRQLCSVIRDTIRAHWIAFTVARILHRDVSAGNIMMTKDGKGLLIDWDLSKALVGDEEVEKARAEWRTGTWQFISGLRLLLPHKTHEYSDDLESFLHVLSYNLLRYRPTNFESLSGDLRELFDQSRQDNVNSEVTGGRGKRDFFLNYLFPMEVWAPTLSEPCANIVRQFRTLFRHTYGLAGMIETGNEARAKPAIKQVIEEALAPLQSCEAALKIFDENLAEEVWPEDGGATFVHIEPPITTPKRNFEAHFPSSATAANSRASKKRMEKAERSYSHSPSLSLRPPSIATPPSTTVPPSVPSMAEHAP
ncbi:hypothetical protein BV25DRAFT_1914183 [Artomyces pyxidatus]|uniref:Uncharacterized protein n=1 Tax=Artomyces pyxidatus TaxID=48021 RepID=A0ACB8T7F3_9AGAM|nr:hypothetical protein BV25DRAFT_1914183 [Artomyces pyxidatus]